jgi:hypothetical protein
MKLLMIILTLLFMTACTDRNLENEEVRPREQDSIKRDGLDPAIPPNVDAD